MGYSSENYLGLANLPSKDIILIYICGLCTVGGLPSTMSDLYLVEMDETSACNTGNANIGKDLETSPTETRTVDQHVFPSQSHHAPRKTKEKNVWPHFVCRVLWTRSPVERRGRRDLLSTI